MRNFLAFIKRFQVVLFFALLQGIALTMYFTFLNFPRTQYMTTASSISGSVFEAQHQVTQYLNLRQNNTWLQKENARLRAEANLHDDQIEQLLREFGVTTFSDTINDKQYKYIPAQVIRSTFTKRNNFFTLNIGSLSGVSRGDGVFSSNGIIGIVHNVSDNYAVVKSCLTENINIAVMIESNGEHGFLKWNGRDPKRGSLIGITNDTEIKKWSNIVTLGSAGIFPRGIPVGKVEKTAVIEGKPMWDVTVLYSENFRRVQRVYVVKNLRKSEQLLLESQVPNEDN